MQRKTKKALRNKNIELISKRQYDKLLKTIFQSIKERDNYNKILVHDIERKNEKIQILEDYIEKELDEVNKIVKGRLTDFKNANNSLVEINAGLQKKNIEITRAYNGLATMGKFAEENGIDIKKHNRDLPEHPLNKYKFEQKHEVLESGKTKSVYTLTPPNKDKKKWTKKLHHTF